MKAEILTIFRQVAAEQKSLAMEDYPVRLSTWSLRARLSDKYPERIWRCHELRAVLTAIPEIEKDEYHSRRGNAVWRLK